MDLDRLVLLIIILLASLSAWLVGVRMRRRIKRALGKSVKSEVELTSLDTWMKVKEEEERNRGRQ
jgi:hypothetical protein